jgi:hypothetical protein
MTLTSLGRKTRTNEHIIGRSSGIKHLVFLQGHRCNQKEIPISGASPRKCGQICSAPLTAPGALPHDILDRIISHVTQVSAKKNLVLFVKFASDLFQIEVTYQCTPATNEFTLILHVPMVSNSNLLKLYEFLPLPIHFNFATNISITPDIGPTNLLAIGHSQSYQTISSSDLHACIHLGDTFFCKGRKVMETSLKRSCLGPLYTANYNAIQTKCGFMIAEAREKIFELSENTWAVYSVGTINTNEVCTVFNDATAMQIQSGDTIKIKPGCYIRMMDHMISAEESEMIEIRIKAMDWAREIKDLFCHGNKETIHQAVQGLGTRCNGEFDATILLDQLDNLQTPDSHLSFTSLAAMIGAAICTFTIGVCIWKICRGPKEPPTPTPSALPMPMQAIAPQPAAAPRASPAPVQKRAINTRAMQSNNAIPINITIT